MPTSVTWRGREVTKQPWRFLLAAVLAIAMVAFFIPLSFPLHLILRLLGGRGFLTPEPDGRYSYNVPWWACVLILAVVALVALS